MKLLKSFGYDAMVGLIVGLSCDLGFAQPSTLSATVDANFNDRFIQEKLAEIGPGVSNAFAFVRDQIGYEAYTGSLRGARGTLWSAAGNSLDRASLLIALLRGQGIPARYVYGTLADNLCQKAILSMFTMPCQVVGLIPPGATLSDPANDRRLLAETREHYWVEFDTGSGFTAADPLFKECLLGQAFAAATERFDEVPDQLRHKVTIRLNAELTGGLSGLVGGPDVKVVLNQTFAAVELVGKPISVGHFVSGYAPPSVGFGYKTYTYSPYLLVDQNDGAISDDPIIRGEDYQEFLTSFPLASEVLTGVFLEVDVAAPGGQARTFQRPLVDRIGFVARQQGGAAPVGIDASDGPAVSELDLTTLTFFPCRASDSPYAAWYADFEQGADQFDGLANDHDLDLEVPTDANLFQQRMSALTRLFLLRNEMCATRFALGSDAFGDILCQELLVRSYCDSPRLIIAGSRVLLKESSAGDGSTIRTFIDTRKTDLRVIPNPGQVVQAPIRFNILRGLADNSLETTEMESFAAPDAHTMSAYSIIQEATQQGIDLQLVSTASGIDALSVSPEAKARMSGAVNAGKLIITPAASVTVGDYRTIAWFELDGVTGETFGVTEDGGHENLIEYGINLLKGGARLAGYYAGGYIAGRVAGVDYAKSEIRGWKMILGGLVGNEEVARVVKAGLTWLANALSGNFGAWNPGVFAEMGLQLALEETARLAGLALPRVGTAFGLGFTKGLVDGIREALGEDPPVPGILHGSLGCNTFAPGAVPGVGIQIYPDAHFTVPANGVEVPSAFRAAIYNLGPMADDFELTFPGQPSGFEILNSLTNVNILAGRATEVGVYLWPTGALAEAGTVVPFTVRAGSLTNPGVTASTNAFFVMPELHGVSMAFDPPIASTTRGQPASVALNVACVGNLPEEVTLAAEVPSSLVLGGLTNSLHLGLDESATLPLSFMPAQDAPLDTNLVVRLVATFGPPSARQTNSIMLLVQVVVPGVVPAANASTAAAQMSRAALAGTLQQLSEDLRHLYGDQTNELYRSRVLADLQGLTRQLDDPLLAPFVADLAAARDGIASSTPAMLEAALEALGTEMTRFGTRLSALVSHDFEVALRPNTAEALPETGTTFGIYLKNKGTQTTTYQLSLSGLPPGITGGLNTNRITLSSGQETSPALAGAEYLWVTLTQPTNQLTAFEFTVTVTAEGVPAITRTAAGAFTARKELVKVVAVEANPRFITPPYTKTEIGTFTGGDVGEGLDLDGNFLYAVNFGAGGTAAQVRDAHFTPQNAAGVSVTTSSGSWTFAVNFGDSQADNELEKVMSTFLYSGVTTPLGVSLAGLQAGQYYKLQLLFCEDHYVNRPFDVVVNGRVVTNDFSPGTVVGGVLNNRGAVITHVFRATQTNLDLTLNPTPASGSPRQSTLYGLTLKAVPAPEVDVSVSARVLNAVNSDRDVLVQYSVRDAQGSTVFTSTPQPVRLTVLSSLDTFELGNFEAQGLATGQYSIDVTVAELNGQPIPGATGSGTVLIGSPVTATMAVAPQSLAPGNHRVSTTLETALSADSATNLITLVGLHETTGMAETVALYDHYAYVGGTSNLTIMDVADPRNPQPVNTLGDGERYAVVCGDHLAMSTGRWGYEGLEVYSLAAPAQPSLVGSVSTGLSSSSIFVQGLFSDGKGVFMNTLLFAWSWGIILDFVRGDLISFDLSDPPQPRSFGLLFNTSHSSWPQYAGSDYWVGTDCGLKDGVLLLPSATVTNSGLGGTGRLVIVQTAGTNAPVAMGDFLVPGTVLADAVAIQGNQALVLGFTDGVRMAGGAPTVSGDLTLTLLDVADPTQPTILGPTTRIPSSGLHSGSLGLVGTRARSLTGGWYVVSGLTRGSQAILILVDASDPTNLQLSEVQVPAQVSMTEIRGNLLYTASSSGLGIYGLGGVFGVPVTAQVRVPNDGSAAVVPGSFNVAPDQTIAGTNFDTLVWHFTLSMTHTNQAVTWQTDLNDLAPGEGREVTHGATVDFTAWGMDSSLELPPLTVVGQHVLRMTPPAQTMRPGEIATYILTVTNATAAPVTYALTLQGLPTNWIALAPSVVVPTQSEAQVLLVLRADTAAAAGDYGFTVRAQAAGGVADTVAGTLTLSGVPVVADQAYGVVATLNPSQATAGQGTPAHFVVRLVNTGNATDTYALSAQLPAGCFAQFGSTNVEVLPGLDNYREVSLTLTPAPGTAAGDQPFTITATSTMAPSVQAVTAGTISVVNLGVVLGLSPRSGPPGSTFTLAITNTGQQAQTFDLVLGGPVAPSANLPTSHITLAAGAWQTLPVAVTNLDYGYPGDLSLFAVATARDNTNVTALATATVQVATNHGLSAFFEPEVVGLPAPGKGYSLLIIRNVGNTEDAFTARITSTSGPLAASLLGPTNQLVQQTGTLRLPGLASGAVLLEGDLTNYGVGTVQVAVSSILNSNLTAYATLSFLIGVHLEFTNQVVVELTFDPIPGRDHFLEYSDDPGPNPVWTELPGGPYIRGLYYLCLGSVCDWFPPNPDGSSWQFIGRGDLAYRTYRVRVEGAEPRPVQLRLVVVNALSFLPLPGANHVLERTDALGQPSQWSDLPGAPHNRGLGFDLEPGTQRFYRVRIQPIHP
jgi:uncharacterized membrane protein